MNVATHLERTPCESGFWYMSRTQKYRRRSSSKVRSLRRTMLEPKDEASLYIYVELQIPHDLNGRRDHFRSYLEPLQFLSGIDSHNTYDRQHQDDVVEDANKSGG